MDVPDVVDVVSDTVLVTELDSVDVVKVMEEVNVGVVVLTSV